MYVYSTLAKVVMEEEKKGNSDPTHTRALGDFHF